MRNENIHIIKHKMSDSLHRALNYLIEIGGGVFCNHDFEIILNFKSKVIEPVAAPIAAQVAVPIAAQVAAPVAAPVNVKERSIAILSSALAPPLPPQPPQPPLPESLPWPDYIPLPPATGGAGTSDSSNKMIHSGTYNEKESQKHVSGVKRSYGEMESDSIKSQDVFVKTIEFKWLMDNFPRRISTILEIEKICYDKSPIFVIKKHYSKNCIYINISTYVYNMITKDYKFNMNTFWECLQIYLKELVRNSNKEILDSIIHDHYLSRYYDTSSIYNAECVEFMNGALIIHKAYKHPRRY